MQTARKLELASLGRPAPIDHLLYSDAASDTWLAQASALYREVEIRRLAFFLALGHELRTDSTLTARDEQPGAVRSFRLLIPLRDNGGRWFAPVGLARCCAELLSHASGGTTRRADGIERIPAVALDFHIELEVDTNDPEGFLHHLHFVCAALHQRELFVRDQRSGEALLVGVNDVRRLPQCSDLPPT